MDSRDIVLTMDLMQDIPSLKIEKNKLMQVIVNLLKNSCDAIDEHNDSRSNQIKISTYHIDDRIGFRISDTGVGVEKERQKNLFDFGISSKGSSGFGLYYCKSFVTANNGILIFESKGLGKGATVIMEFFKNRG